MRREMLSNYLLLVILSSCIFGISPLQAENQDSDSNMISAGIVVVGSASLRKEPDINSEILRRLEFGDPFFVLEKQSFLEGQKYFYWYKVILTDRKTIGWLISKEGREGDFGVINVVDSEKDGLAGLYYSVAYQSFGGSKDYTVAERLFHHILKKYSNTQIPVYSVCSGNISYINGKMGAFSGLAELYKDRKKYPKAIGCYQKIIDRKGAKREDILNATRKIMLIYEENIGDAEKTVELCHYIIREFPDEQISGFEWNLWADIEAAGIIVSNYSRDTKDVDKLMKESEKIISETSNPPVILIATRGIVISRINKGDYESAKSAVLEVMKKYPKEVRRYFLDYVNFTVDPLSGAIETVIGEDGDYIKAIELAKIVRDSIQEEGVTDFANYQIAKLLDEGSGDREQVLSAYENVSSSEFWGPTPRGKVISSWDIKQRIEQIRISQTEEAVVSEDDAIMKPGLESKPSAYEHIAQRTHMTVLYKDREITEIGEKQGNWAKVRLPDGRIEWVFDGFLSLVREKPFFSPLKGKEQIWCMEGANPNRTSAVNAELIKNPTRVKVIPNIVSEEVVFSDVNGDQILDILSYSSKGLIAIDGATQKIIWIFKCSNGSIPVVKEDILYLVAFGKDGEYLYALDKRTATPIWIVLVSKRDRGACHFSPAINDNSAYVTTRAGDLLAVDIRQGAIMWKFSSFCPIAGPATKTNNLVYFVSPEKRGGNDRLRALNVLNGNPVWEFDFHSRAAYMSAIVVEDGILFCDCADGYLYALNAETGHLLWQKSLTGKTSGSHSHTKPSVCKGTVYYATPEKEIYAIDSRTGDTKWKYAYSHNLWGAPAIVNGALYIRSTDSYLHAISSNGQLLWKFKVGSGAPGGVFSPSIAQGLIFVGSTDDNLYVIGEKE